MSGKRTQPRRWTEDELAYLDANRGKISVREMAEHLGRSLDSTNGAIQRYWPRCLSEWTPEDIEYLREHYADTNNETLQKQLHHGWRKIKEMAAKLNLHRDAPSCNGWTSREQRILADMVESGATYAEMEQVLHRSRSAIAWRKHEYFPGLPDVPPSPISK